MVYENVTKGKTSRIFCPHASGKGGSGREVLSKRWLREGIPQGAPPQGKGGAPAL
ncbi:MAG: hypothetical protein IPM61_12935 [Chlorobi bacterium]|nr:hypothetical protein [Chlorobiota bacterium]